MASNWVTGVRALPIEAALRLEDNTEVTLDWLYNGDIQTSPQFLLTQTLKKIRLVPFGDIAPSHPITSSAVATGVGGAAMPSVLAVFRLITNSNLVGCNIGRSAAFRPSKYARR